jgi:hypothetical protein
VNILMVGVPVCHPGRAEASAIPLRKSKSRSFVRFFFFCRLSTDILADTGTAYLTIKEDRLCTYNVTLRRVRVTVVTVKSNKYYIFWVVFVAVLIQHAKRMCHVACPAAPS